MISALSRTGDNGPPSFCPIKSRNTNLGSKVSRGEKGSLQLPHTTASQQPQRDGSCDAQTSVALCPARAVANERNMHPGHASCYAGNRVQRFVMENQPGLLVTRSRDHNQRVSFAPSLWGEELEAKPRTSGSHRRLAGAFDSTRTSFVSLLYDSPMKWETSLHPGEEGREVADTPPAQLCGGCRCNNRHPNPAGRQQLQ